MLTCAHCGKPGGCLALATLPDAAAGQPAAAAAPAGAPRGNGPGQRPRQQEQQQRGNGDAPLCGRCGQEPVGWSRKRNNWFPTCFNCG